MDGCVEFHVRKMVVWVVCLRVGQWVEEVHVGNLLHGQCGSMCAGACFV
jgi:hypothetical protein